MEEEKKKRKIMKKKDEGGIGKDGIWMQRSEKRMRNADGGGYMRESGEEWMGT